MGMTSISGDQAGSTGIAVLAKTPSGITGFDEITHGGLPVRRPTLICGGPGCGKTLFAMTFLVNGATRFDEPGVFISFEEEREDLAINIASLGYDARKLEADNHIVIEYVHIEKSETDEAGDYNLEGLFVRLAHAIDRIGAKRIVLDTPEVLFAGLGRSEILRAELRRLFAWLKAKGVTAVITAEIGNGTLTRFGLEEYVSDCVLLLDNRVAAEVTTRRLRIVKYRGSAHGTNEYPFLIDSRGISVLPVTSLGLSHQTSDETVSTGVEGLDVMLGAGGFFRGSSVLISGTAGTGKTSFACHFIDAACRRGQACLVFAFEESPAQIVRNMRSIGIDLQPWVDRGLLRFEAARPSVFGIEMHLAKMHRDIQDFSPDVVVLDPISSLRGQHGDVHSALLRIIDLLKTRGTTALLTNLISGGQNPDATDSGMSSLMDTWLSLTHHEANGERNRALYILKARGMAHSNQIREFEITSNGLHLINAYVGSGGVLIGSARLAREAADTAEELLRRQMSLKKRREMERRRAAVERQIVELQASLKEEEEETHGMAVGG